MPYNRVRCFQRPKDDKEQDETTTGSTSSITKEKDENQTSPERNSNNGSSYRQRLRRSSATSRRVTLASIEKTFIGPYVALDCEMVGVGPGGVESAVARVSAVKWSKEEVILDTFVKVPEPVTDYRTFVSGVTKEDLESDNAMPFEECREIVRHCLQGRVLVGHALSNDLKALNLEHPARDIRDTSTYIPFMQVAPTNPFGSPGSLGSGTMELRPRKLRDLARDKLGLDIQRMGQAHNSVQDARVALRLYRLVREEWERLLLWQVGRTFDRQFFQGYENTENGPTLKGKPIELPMQQKVSKEEENENDEARSPRRGKYTLGAWFPKKESTCTSENRVDDQTESSKMPAQKLHEEDEEEEIEDKETVQSPKHNRYTFNAWFPKKENAPENRKNHPVYSASESAS